MPTGDPDVLADQARALRLTDDVPGFEDAVPLLREAIELDPTHDRAYCELSQTYSSWGLRRERSCLGFRWESRVLEFQSLYDMAFEYARTALGLAPDRAAPHAAMAVALRHGAKADPERRGREARQALDLAPDDPECLCEVWRVEGYDPDAAAPRRALEREPGLISVRADLARALSDRGRYDEARAELKAALAVSPSNTALHYELAMLLDREALRAEALAVMRRARDLRPDDPLIKQGFILLGEVTCS